ncbi:30S ribosomal protein S1 [Chloroflexota bacterium]
MSGWSHQGDRTMSSPPEVDEAYWSALLQEGEMAPEEEATSAPALWDEIGFVEYRESSEISDEHHFPQAADWLEMRNLMESDLSLELPVIGSNRGGLLVQWKSLRGFVPASQLVDFPPTVGEHIRRQELTIYVGRSLLLRIIELDEMQNRLILSERAAQVNPGTRAAILDSLSEGDVCYGTVTNVCDFGVFVDFGGIEGLIHISELSWGRVGHPGDVLRRGQHVSVYVMEVNKDLGRVALSVKRLQDDPWKTVNERYTVGQIVTGTVTNVVDFGAFACIEDGLEGLIHISELAEGHFLHPRNVVREGDVIHARILNIDGPSRRLGLSLREQSTV